MELRVEGTRSFWKDRPTLITGATGMVGSWLVKELLSAGAHVVTLIRDADPQSELLRSRDIDRTSVVNGELESFLSVERAVNEHEIDTIFHLGAQTIVGTAHRNPLPTFESNIRGTYHVLEAARIHGKLVKRVVVASSDKAYGTHESLPYKEEMPLQGRHPYEVSKSCADLLAASYHHSFDSPVAIARCGNIFGGGDLNWSRIVPGSIRSLLRGESPLLRSDGSFIRDYIFVKDVARAYMLLAEKIEDDGVRGGAFNFSNEQPLTVLQLVTALQRVMRSEHLQPTILNSAIGEIRDQYLSSEKARELLGWQPEFSLELGLRETVAWYEEFFGSRTQSAVRNS